MDLDEDVLLLTELRDGNDDAYERIMRRHNQRLFRLVRSIVANDDDAMDVVQDTFIIAFEHLGDLSEPRAFAIWLARIAKNHALMRLRKTRRYVHMEDDQLEQAIQKTASLHQEARPDQELANRQLGVILEQSIAELPDDFRIVFVLRSIEGCSTSATADMLELREATVKTRLHRARKLMQARVLAYCEDAGSTVYEFAGHRCDAIVRNVLRDLHQFR